MEKIRTTNEFELLNPQWKLLMRAMTSAHKLIDQYRAVIFDMNGTFMFHGDRFGPQQDYYSTYLEVGGTTMSRDAVQSAIAACHSGMNVEYVDAGKVDNFGSVQEGLIRFAGMKESSLDELSLLEEVFADHELGVIPTSHSNALQGLGRTHRLGLLTNIWAPKRRWIEQLRISGLSDIFSTQIFSSDGRNIKPSSTLFQRSIESLAVPAHEILYVGDSLCADMIPAKRVGMTTAFIQDELVQHWAVDSVFKSILEL